MGYEVDETLDVLIDFGEHWALGESRFEFVARAERFVELEVVVVARESGRGLVRCLLLFLILEPALQHHHEIALHRGRVGGHHVAGHHRITDQVAAVAEVFATDLRPCHELRLRSQVASERHVFVAASAHLSRLLHCLDELDGEGLAEFADVARAREAVVLLGIEDGTHGFGHRAQDRTDPLLDGRRGWKLGRRWKGFGFHHLPFTVRGSSLGSGSSRGKGDTMMRGSM